MARRRVMHSPHGGLPEDGRDEGASKCGEQDGEGETLRREESFISAFRGR